MMALKFLFFLIKCLNQYEYEFCKKNFVNVIVLSFNFNIFPCLNILLKKSIYFIPEYSISSGSILSQDTVPKSMHLVPLYTFNFNKLKRNAGKIVF